MKIAMCVITTAALIACATPARAGENLNPSEQVVMVAVVSAAIPFLLASYGVQKVATAVKESPSMNRRVKSPLVKAQPLPTMRVAEVRKLEDAGDEVILVPLDAQFAGNKTVLQFPAMKDSPAGSFSFGQVVTLMPAGDANGWWVTTEGGQNIAYVPTTSTAQLAGSRAL
jgi:hypothetical protein